MSRTIIGGIVAVAIAALTAVLFFLVSGSMHRPLQREARALIKRAPEQALNNATLGALDTYTKVELLSHDDGVLAVMRSTVADDRAGAATSAFNRFRAKPERDGLLPDVLVLVDATGSVVARDGVANPVAGEFKKDDKVVWPGLALALTRPTLVSEIWNYPGKGVMRVGVGTITDPDKIGADGKPTIIGAVVLAYSFTSKAARTQQAMLGAEVAYFDSGQVFATSFRRSDGTEDTTMQAALTPILKQGDLVASALAKGQAGKFVSASGGGHSYLASAVRLPRIVSVDPLPPGYPEQSAGILVLTDADPGASEYGQVGLFLLILGGVAIALGVAGIFLASQRILHQVDEIELGIADIINGNLDRTFRPVGDDLDGVANGLNVMLARLLGRPEPGEEGYDDDGNPVQTGRVEFDEGEPRPTVDADLTALAQEPEPDYYTRVFSEYKSARREAGNPDEVSFEGFITKLRVNEGRLKAQYQCRAVRFRVVTKDSKVSLKPVPIV
jgi:hypothetical protein